MWFLFSGFWFIDDLNFDSDFFGLRIVKNESNCGVLIVKLFL